MLQDGYEPGGLSWYELINYNHRSYESVLRTALDSSPESLTQHKNKTNSPVSLTKHESTETLSQHRSAAVIDNYRKMFRACPLCLQEQQLEVSQPQQTGLKHRLTSMVKKKKKAVKEFFKGLFGCFFTHDDDYDDTYKSHEEDVVCSKVYML